ncbi:MAG TPA: hypothetical protein VF734_09555 [Pseudonocardiaceae bacterium]
MGYEGQRSTEDRRGGQLTARLVMLALTIILLGTAGGLADARQNTAQRQTRVQELTTAVLAGTATQTSLDEARAQLAASLDREKVIQARIDEVALTGRVGPHAQLLTPSYPLPGPVSPQPLIAAGTGALVGLLIAGGAMAVGAGRRTKL